MKNVLYITYDGLLDPVSQSQVLPYLKKLSAKGIKISIISFEKKERLKDKKAFNLCQNELKSCSLKWIPLRYHKLPLIPATIFDILQGVCLGFTAILSKKNGLIHARGYVAALIALFLKYVTGSKIVFDMRGFWPDEKVDAGAWKKNGMLYFFVKKIEKQLITRTDEIVVLTEAAKKYLSDKFPHASTTVIPCCVDTNVFEAEKNKDKDIIQDKARNRFIITYLGSLGTFYELEGMIAFFKIFKMKQSQAFFKIVTNSSHQRVQVLIQKSHLDNSDYAVSNLEYQEVPFALANSDVSIMFYRRHLSGIGCSPIKFSESLSCGVPVIINSDIGDTEELLKKERIGVVVDSLSEMALEKAADELMQLLSEGDRLRNRCRRIAERYFSLTEGIKKYWQVYQNVLKR